MHRPEAIDPDDAGPAVSARERRLPVLLLAAALLLAAWSAIVWQTGGFGVDVPWGRLSSRDPLRPFAAALLCVAVLVWRTGPRGLTAAARHTTAWLHSCSPAGAALAAALVCWAGIAYGTQVAGGSDPYGYVSQADLWLRGSLTLDFGSLAPLPWQRVEWTLSPLGYRPGLEPYTIVPTYAPGLPMLMALVQAVFGPGAKYFVVPLCAAAAVWLTYLLGARLYDRFAGLIAAVLLAASPAFLYQAMWPMSDVPAAAFWTLALVSACSKGRLAPFAAGLAAAIAILIRPNLVPLAVVPALLIFGNRAGDYRARLSAIGAFGAGVLPGIVMVAGLNTYWYGSPGRSGYGTGSSLFALRNFWPNAGRYPRWLFDTQTPIVLLALLPLVTGRLGSGAAALRRPRVRGACALFVVLMVALYWFYLVFEEWWYLRFFLPTFPLLMVLMSAGLRDVLHRIHPSAAPAAAVVTALLVAWMVQEAGDRAVFGLQQQERGYVTMAQAVAAEVPPDGVVLAMQHSGSLRYYGDRLTLRYDLLRPNELDVVVKALRERGRRVYVLVEEWELPAFVKRFGSHSCRGRLDWTFSRLVDGIRTARLYELTGRTCTEGLRRRTAKDPNERQGFR